MSGRRNVLVSAREQIDIDTARRDERHRIAFLQRLLLGGADPAELVMGGAVHGVVPDREYWVVRGRQLAGEEQRLSRHLGSSRAEFRPLVATFDDDVVGISAARPGPFDGAVIAVAGPASLSGIAQTFAEATRVLNIAVRYGEQLFRRYVAGPDCTTPTEILETLPTYLHERRSVAATARMISIHDNTVRYRLDRYGILTGADLADTNVRIEVLVGDRIREYRTAVTRIGGLTDAAYRASLDKHLFGRRPADGDAI